MCLVTVGGRGKKRKRKEKKNKKNVRIRKEKRKCFLHVFGNRAEKENKRDKI